MSSQAETFQRTLETWGVIAMIFSFLLVAIWPLLPRSKKANDHAAHMIFEEDDNV